MYHIYIVNLTTYPPSPFLVRFAPMAEASGVNGLTFAAILRDRGPIRGSLSNPRLFSKPRRNLDTGLLKSTVRFTADDRSSKLLGVCGELNKRSAPSEGGDSGGVVGSFLSLLTGDSSDKESLKGLENPRSQPSSMNSGEIGSTSREELALLADFVDDRSIPQSVSSSRNGRRPNLDFMNAIKASRYKMIEVRFKNYFDKSELKNEQSCD